MYDTFSSDCSPYHFAPVSKKKYFLYCYQHHQALFSSINNNSTVFLLLFIYKDCFRGPDTVWQLEKKHSVDYFTLEDLWGHYSESSAYGLAVPVHLQTTGKSITQHFVPYLSAIQIYTAKALAGVPRFALLII